MRIATYNVEWFSNLFDRHGKMLEDGELSARFEVTRGEQLGALGIVFTALNADAVLIIEAPDNNRRRKTVPMLERFARALRAAHPRGAASVMPMKHNRKLHCFMTRMCCAPGHDPQADGVPRFDGSYRIDLNIDAEPETVTFSKPPLEVAVLHQRRQAAAADRGAYQIEGAAWGEFARGRGAACNREPAQAIGAVHLAARPR